MRGSPHEVFPPSDQNQGPLSDPFAKSKPPLPPDILMSQKSGYSGPLDPELEIQNFRWSEIWRLYVATRATIYRSLRALRTGPNIKKYPTLNLFGVFFVTFSGVSGDFSKKTLFETFCDLGPGGSRDSCRWSLGSQALQTWWASNRLGPPKKFREPQIGPKFAPTCTRHPKSPSPLL